MGGHFFGYAKPWFRKTLLGEKLGELLKEAT
jgi:hypothetical protein